MKMGVSMSEIEHILLCVSVTVLSMFLVYETGKQKICVCVYFFM